MILAGRLRSPCMKKLVIIDHPLAKCHLATIRDQTTLSAGFRAGVRRLATLLAYEATRGLRLDEITVQTPLESCTGHRLANRVGLVPILRAGLGMVEPVLDLVPSAEVWHLGLYRDEQTAEPIRYYSKLKPNSPVEVALILDPMLATGGSAAAACQSLSNWGVGRISVLSIISAPEGVARLHDEFPDVEILTCVVDQCLNESKFIVPGLGDAGDRIFNTCN